MLERQAVRTPAIQANSPSLESPEDVAGIDDVTAGVGAGAYGCAADGTTIVCRAERLLKLTTAEARADTRVMFLPLSHERQGSSSSSSRGKGG